MIRWSECRVAVAVAVASVAAGTSAWDSAFRSADFSTAVFVPAPKVELPLLPVLELPVHRHPPGLAGEGRRFQDEALDLVRKLPIRRV